MLLNAYIYSDDARVIRSRRS